MVESDAAPVFTKWQSAVAADPFWTVSHWPGRLKLATDLLSGGDRRVIRADEGGVDFVVANGQARYRFVEKSPYLPYVECERVSAIWMPVAVEDA